MRKAELTYSIDPKWDIVERIRVIRYLRDGRKIREHNNVEACNYGCPSYHGLGPRDYTDGIWEWPESLAHYVECHGVKPEEDFLEHIRVNLYRVPPASSHFPPARASSPSFPPNKKGKAS